VYVSDEIGPHIREFSLSTGNTMLDITPSTSSQLGVYSKARTNFSWETFGRQSNGLTAWTMNQEALTVDGKVTSLYSGSLVRSTTF
jgi:hypothetical protein